MERASRPSSESPFGWMSERRCCHTRYMVEPGRYSQRRTALPRSDWLLKSWFSTVKMAAGPLPSGSIA